MFPGMVDFFGKKLGGFVRHAASHLSPVDLHDMAGLSRLKNSARNLDFKSMVQEVRNRAGGAGKFTIGKYLTGFNADDIGRGAASALSDNTRMIRAAMRIGIPTGIGFAAAFGTDNPLGRAVGGIGQLGLHTVGTAAMGAMNPYAGMGYAGWAGLNLLRSGDNMGPF